MALFEPDDLGLTNSSILSGVRAPFWEAREARLRDFLLPACADYFSLAVARGDFLAAVHLGSLNPNF